MLRHYHPCIQFEPGSLARAFERVGEDTRDIRIGKQWQSTLTRESQEPNLSGNFAAFE